MTSPMGWNSWDCYGAAVNEKTVRKNAEYMADKLKKYGWEYVVVDIQWYEPTAQSHEYHPFTELCMNEYGQLMPAENRFPSAKGGKGFAALAEYVHSLGLKFGIHIMRGIPRQAVHNDLPVSGTAVTARQIAKTDSICSWNTDMYGVDASKPGAYEYYLGLFRLYASWGVDFVKCDDICREMPHCREELRLISRAAKECGREIVLSISPGPALLEEAELYKETAAMWRITDDFWDEWRLLYGMFERCEKWCTHTGLGNYPDADMLPIGALRQDYSEDDRTKFTEDEQYTMLTLWSIFRSPLFIGGEMTKFDKFTLDLVTNEGILDMHKNARHAHQVFRKSIDGNELILWIAACAYGGSYIALFNAGESTAQYTLDLKSIELEGEHSYTELWSAAEGTGSSISCEIPSHGAKAYYLR